MKQLGINLRKNVKDLYKEVYTYTSGIYNFTYHEERNRRRVQKMKRSPMLMD
jgi:hypothetical protein